MAGPIKPSEVDAKKMDYIPEEIFEAFNELIVKNYSGGQATFKQNDVLMLAAAKLTKRPQYANLRTEHIRAYILKEHQLWLDVEVFYMQAGWTVFYDKPGFNENYPATFQFKKRTI